MSTKFQRLKNTQTLARVLIIDEMPEKSAGTQKTRDTEAIRGKTDGMRISSSEGASLDDRMMSQASGTNKGNTDKSQAPKLLMFYPEENHTVKQEECEMMNSRVMTHIMK